MASRYRSDFIESSELKDWIGKSGVLILDFQAEETYKNYHIKDSVHVPLMPLNPFMGDDRDTYTLSFLNSDAQERLSKSKKVFIYDYETEKLNNPRNPIEIIYENMMTFLIDCTVLRGEKVN